MLTSEQQDTVIVIDVETTGMNPEKGDRVIEIGAVKMRGRQVLERFESLIRPEFLVSREIESLTGITNGILQQAPSRDEVMPRFIRFISHHPFVAHNAAFDSKFIESELSLFGKSRPLNFNCTLQLSRRIYPDLVNYKLGTLVQYKKLQTAGQFHRALADADMTAQLWLAINEDLIQRYGFHYLPFDLLKKAAGINKEQVHEFLTKAAADTRHQQIDTTGNLFG